MIGDERLKFDSGLSFETPVIAKYYPIQRRVNVTRRHATLKPCLAQARH